MHLIKSLVFVMINDASHQSTKVLWQARRKSKKPENSSVEEN
jgi:hypothetical protein